LAELRKKHAEIFVSDENYKQLKGKEEKLIEEMESILERKSNGPGFHEIDGHPLSSISRNDDNSHIFIDGLHNPEQFNTRDIRQFQIEEEPLRDILRLHY
jgi:hypothetical protein